MDRLGNERDWVWRYLLAAHIARSVVAAFALYVAVRTTDEIPVAGWLSVLFASLGLCWIAGLGLLARPLDRLLRVHPRLIWVDAGVLIGLSLLDKPWDAMVAVPFGAFLLLVVYGSPGGILGLIVTMAGLQYLPKVLLTALDWRYADLCPPTSSADWLTAYVGPVFAGTICWALCVLVAGVSETTREWDRAQDSLTEAILRREDARARRAVADRLHETISQAARAIPLRLDSSEPAGIDAKARQLRGSISSCALRLRPQVQAAARALRGGSGMIGE